MTRRRTSLRRAMELAACLAAGCVMTVVLAWASAIWAPLPTMPPIRVMGVVEKDGSLRPCPQTLAGSRLGFHLEYDAHVAWEGPPGPGRSIGSEFDAQRFAAGWPLLALECAVVYGPKQPDGHVRAVEKIGSTGQNGMWLVDGIAAKRLPGLHPQVFRFIPLRPRFLGLLADAAIVGGLLWFAAFGWRDVRAASRARRGACVACGYPVTGLARCPECGMSAWARLMERVRAGVRTALGGLAMTIGMRRTVR